ncbi:protein phosphatase 2C domain-containing protein [Streptomyces sp. NBC_00234]|uniref:protein phosphatase 2C domain-containing protein n=1 Tax=Streptomyces sp. NBC_00234 TaxID=2903638 RepID=UPI002E2CFF77|nr:protein phosphatase 2C domain-containing protein [Streptomyces sp. NBC_00234]
MSQQGERPAAHEDDWWRRLYDETAPDTGPSGAADSLDDRFDSASDAVGSAADRVDADPVREQVAEGEREPRSASAVPAQERMAETQPQTPAELQTPTESQPRPPTELPVPVPGPGPVPEPPSGPVPPPVPVPPTTSPPVMAVRAPWEPPSGSRPPRTFPAPPPQPPTPPPPPVAESAEAAGASAGAGEREPTTRTATDTVPDGVPLPASRPPLDYLGDRPPTYDAEPTALPASSSMDLQGLVPDTVLDGARYGTYTLRAASVRGDSARFRGEPRRDALLTARFGAAESALVLVAVAGGARAAEEAHLAAADAVQWIGGAVGRSHARLSDDIRAGRRGDLKSGLHRLTDRTYGKLRARAAELGLEPGDYTASLRCLLLSADPQCRTRIFFGVGAGGLFRLRDGVWQDLEPRVPDAGAVTGEAVVGFGSAPPGGADSEEGPDGDRLTMDLQITTPPSPYVESPVPPPSEPFRFRASVACPGDTLLLCSNGLADPMRGEPALAKELAERWSAAGPPGLAAYLADTQLRIKGYADDRTSAAVWEA